MPATARPAATAAPAASPHLATPARRAGATRDLTRGPIGPTLLRFALPILGGNVLQSLNGSVNAYWVGGHLGEAALTATANANNILFLLIGAVFGVGMAATILVAQAFGAHDVRQARCVMGTSATFFGAAALVIAAVGMPLSRHILVAMGTPHEALAPAESYLRMLFLAIPFLYLFTFLSAVLRGAGDARTPFLFLLLAVALDVVLNPLLIFGIGPFPRLGIAGSGLSTGIGNALALLALLLWLRARRHPLWIGRADWRLFAPRWAIVRTLLAKGLPMGAQMVLISVSMLMMLGLVNAHGVATASAYGAALQLWTYVQMPAMAIGAACSSMAAQNVGAQRWDRVDSVARWGVGINFLLTGTLIGLLLLAQGRVLALFLPAGSAALAIARHLDAIALWSFLFFGVSFVLTGVVRSTGAVLAPLAILAVALWGIRVPLAWGLQDRLGVDAIWWSFPVSAVAAMLMTMAYYRFGRWRRARLLAPGEEESLATPAEVGALPPAPLCDTAADVPREAPAAVHRPAPA
ncbi:putative efflux protein, MATE family [Oryzisolibacter propanilivorax]|uniref:Putative efflux protein, MATE family n=1 Tax=Oryzisolibacter propanilivorax TaxID=1527607 RepID=A0A1G9V715_9BURK|nr:MATE family efflux transporter [Oryzisolibacter propanilivorax]SDM67856.1 putative efflux protein, MATE family [Oryzisolibacter propanilivorax]